MEPNTQGQESYMNTAVTYAAIVGIVVFILNIAMMYWIYGGEPSGSFFSAGQFAPLSLCLVSVLGSVLAVKAHVGEYGPVKIGQGAVIGLVTGLIMAVIVTVLSSVWNFIDPEYMRMVSEYQIENYEIMLDKGQITEQMFQQMRDEMMKQMENPNSLTNLGIGFGVSALMYGIINVIGGLITAKVTDK